MVESERYHIHNEVVIQETLTKDEEKLLKELARKSRFNPRIKKTREEKSIDCEK